MSAAPRAVPSAPRDSPVIEPLCRSRGGVVDYSFLKPSSLLASLCGRRSSAKKEE